MLPKEDIKKLLECYQTMIKRLQDLVVENPVAKYLHKTKIPKELSESLIAHALLDGHLTLSETPITAVVVTNNNKAPDIMVEIDKKECLCVEVKATSSDFISMGKKDYKADYLFWICLLPENQCTILKYIKPETLKTRTDRLVLSKLKEVCIPENLSSTTFSFETLLS